MANSFSLMTTIIGQIIPSNCTEVLHVKNVSQVMKIVTILIGVLLVMISYFDPPWTFYSLVPSFWTFFDRMMIIWWCQIEIKKRLFKKIYESVWCFFLGDEKIRESREREKEKNDFSIEIVLDILFFGTLILDDYFQYYSASALVSTSRHPAFLRECQRLVVQDEQRYQWKCGWTWRRKYLGWLDAKQRTIWRGRKTCSQIGW